MEFANVGSADRIFRIVLGAILLALPFFTSVLGTGTLSIVSMVAGVVLILTGLFSFCPAYRVLGMRTTTEKV